MARCSHALLSFFLLTCVLVQTSYCSRSSPKEPQAKPQKPAVHSVYVVDGDERLRRDEARIRPVEKELIAGPDHGADADGALPVSPATMSAAGGHDGAAVSRRRSGALAPRVWRYSVVPHLKLARRFLVGEDTDTAGGPSCRSNDKSKTCPPAALH